MKRLLAIAMGTGLVAGLKSYPASQVRKILSSLPEAPDEALDWAGRFLEPEACRMVAERLAILPEIRDALSALEESGIACFWEGDDLYPKKLHRLGAKKPAVLFAAGDISLANHRLIGFVGSRNADEAALAFCKSSAARMAGRGWGVVSGGAKGVDTAAAEACRAAGGSTVEIVADSLLRRASRFQGEVERKTALILSVMATPNAAFSIGAAMARNKLVYALAETTVIAASKMGSGGTWEGALEAMRIGVGNVAVWKHGGEGNQELARRGARAIESIDEIEASASQENRTLF